MVNKESPVYLFIGQDSPAKDYKLARIKTEFLPTKLKDFNLDVLYAKELDLKGLQEQLLGLPVKARKRMIVIKEAQDLREEIKEFLFKYVKNPFPNIILVLDIDKFDPRNEFIKGIARFCQTYRFHQPLKPDTFALSRQINLKRADSALKVLNQLLRNGEKPERILGGLRYSFERQRDKVSALQIKRRLAALIACDINIKTGWLRPNFALERLVVNLCSLM